MDIWYNNFLEFKYFIIILFTNIAYIQKNYIFKHMDIHNIDTSKIPHKSGVYIFKNKKWKVLYIGKAKSLQKRIAQYFSPNSLWKQEMMQEASEIEYITTKNEHDALFLEENLIKEHQPEYNKLLKNNSQYTYIKITNHKFPQIFLSRRRKNDNATYIGPKYKSIALKKLLQYCKEYFQRRWCTDTQFKKGKVCSQYYFATCKWRCKRKKDNKPPNLQDKDITPQNYQHIITNISNFFNWQTTLLKDKIYEDIQSCIEVQNFERASFLKEIYTNIDAFTYNQHVILPSFVICYFCYITLFNDWFVIVIVKINKGKIVDIIRTKKKNEDNSLGSITILIEQEFKNTFTFFPANKRQYKYSKENIDKIKQFPIYWIASDTSKSAIKKKDFTQLEQVLENSVESYISSDALSKESVMNSLLLTLQNRYTLKNFPYRIECIDISHLSWGRISWWLSCTVGWLPYPKWYRRYNLSKNDFKNNDYAQLQQIITSRFKLSNNNKNNFSMQQLPDFFIIDWGKWQLNILKELSRKYKFFNELHNKIDFVALEKWDARQKSHIWYMKKNKRIAETIYFFDSDGYIQKQNVLHDEVDRIITNTRDKAHKFANSYRKKQMSMEREKK